MPGPQGTQGIQGIPGMQGNDGRDGRDGQDGEDGDDSGMQLFAVHDAALSTSATVDTTLATIAIPSDADDDFLALTFALELVTGAGTFNSRNKGVATVRVGHSVAGVEGSRLLDGSVSVGAQNWTTSGFFQVECSPVIQRVMVNSNPPTPPTGERLARMVRMLPSFAATGWPTLAQSLAVEGAGARAFVIKGRGQRLGTGGSLRVSRLRAYRLRTPSP